MHEISVAAAHAYVELGQRLCVYTWRYKSFLKECYNFYLFLYILYGFQPNLTALAEKLTKYNNRTL